MAKKQKPEEQSREIIDRLLEAAGWVVQDVNEANLTAATGVAIREFPLKKGHGFADYMLYVSGHAIGVVEAKKGGQTLSGVETQSKKYIEGLPDDLPALSRPLPFHYESTGNETWFTNRREPDARSRQVFAFHRPETLAEYVEESPLRANLKKLPPLIETGLWHAQIKTIKNLELSLARNDPRALIQMATGSGKTFTACNFIYRLIRHANAKRVLFLVDRGNLGRQTLKEFQGFSTPDDGRKFTELYNVQHLKHNKIDTPSRVVISTVQRMFSMLRGDEALEDELDEGSLYDSSKALFEEPEPIEYNPAIPIETFDIIVIDECHRSIFNVWRQVLDYFDAMLIGLTATPSKQAHGFFKQNLVNSYSHDQAVADGVNVGYDVYRILTEITAGGSTVEAGLWIDQRDRKTGVRNMTQLEDDLEYEGRQLDRDVVAEDQIRKVLQAFRDRALPEAFPGRTEVPKTLIFAKSDRHADDIVRTCREVFGKGNDFAQKITYNTTGKKSDDLIQEFRTSYFPRIAVTVDMIATGTDIKPLECVMFMRTVKSQNYFEQMKGRGVRICSNAEFRSVNQDEVVKERFVLVDCVGVCEVDKGDSRPLIQQPSVSFDALLKHISFGGRSPEAVSTLAGRLARLNRKLEPEQRQAIEKASGGQTIEALARKLVDAANDDVVRERALQTTGEKEPSEETLAKSKAALIDEAVKPFATNPKLREALLGIHREHYQTIDTVSEDQVLEAGFSADAKEKAQALARDFEQFIRDNRDDIAALQVLYSRPYKNRLTFDQLKELVDVIKRPPRQWTPEKLWQAYEALDQSKVRGHGGQMLTDLVALIKYALHHENQLLPFKASVEERFDAWLAERQSKGQKFSKAQLEWLTLIRDHVSTSLGISQDDFEQNPTMVKKGGLGAVYDTFGDALYPLLDELNETLAA